MLEPRRPYHLLVCAVALLGATAFAATSAVSPDAVRRTLALLGGAAGEYAEAFDASGQLVRPIELEEASLLLAEARDVVEHLDPAARAAVAPAVEAFAKGLAGRLPTTQVDALSVAARQALSDATGVVEDTTPPAPPSVTRGGAVFLDNCARCHGADGAGDGPDAAALDQRPARFNDPAFMRGETPRDFFHVITLGRRRAGMPAWGDALSLQDRWDVVAYLWTLARPMAAIPEGQGVWVAQCAGCHGATGDGAGPFAAGLTAPVTDLTGVDPLAGRTDAEIAAIVTGGVPGTSMPAFGRLLDAGQVAAVTAFVRTIGLGGPVDKGGSAARPGESHHPDTTAAFTAARELVDRAVAAYRVGDAGASALATDAYTRFEPLEKAIGARDAAAVRGVEEAFLRLRTALRTSGAEAEVMAAAMAVDDRLDAAAAVLAPGGGWARFVQSFTIIFREGFEIVLVITALLAYVRRGGHLTMLRWIWGGVAAGVAASLATAALLTTVFRLTPGLADLLEGAAMLLAAVVLFWVSYWLISKAEADRWQRYIRGKVQHAIASGSGAALGAAAFLAVYREGFETVLFYQALFGGAPAGDVMVLAGFGAGLLALGVVYAGFARLGLAIPIRQFFLVTGGLLYAMAVVFAGKGVHELQEVGWIGVTPVAGVPTIDVLGVHPSVETLAVQGLFLAALLYAMYRTLRRRGEPSDPAASPPAPRADVTPLRARDGRG